MKNTPSLKNDLHVLFPELIKEKTKKNDYAQIPAIGVSVGSPNVTRVTGAVLKMN